MLSVVENVLRKEETLAPNRTGNLISPSLSSSINLPSGTGTINKDRTLCDTLTGQMGVRGGELRPSASTKPYSWQNWTATPGPILNFLSLTHTDTQTQSYRLGHWNTQIEKHTRKKKGKMVVSLYVSVCIHVCVCLSSSSHVYSYRGWHAHKNTYLHTCQARTVYWVTVLTE